MNGSRSDTHRPGERSSLDALNRTIEGLEARIEGLIDEAQRRDRGQAVPERASDPLTEILSRQRSLAQQPRERLSQALERRGDDAYRAAPRHAEALPRARDGLNLEDIAATLKGLRAELRDDIDTSLNGQLKTLRGDIARMAEAPLAHADMTALRQDVEELGRMMDHLARDMRPQDLGPIAAEFAELKTLIARKADADSVARLERGWSDLAGRLEQGTPDSLHEEIVSLAWRLEDMKNALGALDSGPAIRKLEDKLIQLATAVEAMTTSHHGGDRFADQFSAIDARLDEISRAIAAAPRGAVDSQAFGRLEERLDLIATDLDRFGKGGADQEIARRLAALTERVEEVADRKAAERLEARIADLSATIDRFQGHTGGDYSAHFADLAARIDTLDATGATSDMIDRLERLAARIEAFERASASSVPSTGSEAFGRLETQLTDIAARLDRGSVASSVADPAQMAGLERQIANLSALLSQPRAAGMPAAMDGDLDQRLHAIEDYIASNDEYILEAARHAAETVVEAYQRQGQAGAPGLGQSEIAALSGLAEDLRALEDFTRASDDRNFKTFEALHETLVQISDRLNDIDRGEAPAQPRFAAAKAPAPMASEAAKPVRQDDKPAPVMPRATQPVFEPVEAEAQPVRMERPNATVPVLDDPMLSPAAERDDDRADEPVLTPPTKAEALAEEPAPSKSFIVNLSRKIMSRAKAAKADKPAKADKAATPSARTQIEPTPALDGSDVMPDDLGNQTIEPGKGAPDVKSILARVRAGKSQTESDDRSDIVAAARRAAEAAAAEISAGQKPGQKGGKGKEQSLKELKASVAAPSSGSLLSRLGDNRRPVLLAAGAILLVLMSYPLVSTLIKKRLAPGNPAAIEATVASDNATATKPVEAKTDSAPLAIDTDTAPAETTKAVPDVSSDATDVAPVKATEDAKAAPDATDVMLNPGTTTEAASPLLPADAAKPADTATFNAPADAVKPAEAQAAAITIPDVIKVPALAEAARSGDALALFEIGARFTEGTQGAPVDLKQAIAFYQLAADRGFAPAQYRLANFYEKGNGVDRDITKARTLYEKAATAGNASAMHNLAVLLSSGADGNPDFDGAAKWFEAAANRGVTDSQYNLAILHARGNGVAKDFIATYKWFAIAARAGDKDAAAKRDEVAQVLSKQELEKAKAEADLFKPVDLDPAANSVTVPDAWNGKPDTTASVDVKKAIRNIQAILNNNGFDAGKPDGEIGARTTAAIRAFQAKNGLPVTGKIDEVLVRKLLELNRKS